MTASDNDDRPLKIVSANVRKYRQVRGMTQEELAFESGMDRSYLGHLEATGKNISILKLFALADALEVDPRELLRPAEEWE